MPEIPRESARAALWRDIWELRGQHSTPIIDVGYGPHMRRGPHPEYAAPWHPDDAHRERNRIRRESDAHPLDGGW